jgi:hypothetical protein
MLIPVRYQRIWRHVRNSRTRELTVIESKILVGGLKKLKIKVLN